MKMGVFCENSTHKSEILNSYMYSLLLPFVLRHLEERTAPDKHIRSLHCPCTLPLRTPLAFAPPLVSLPVRLPSVSARNSKRFPLFLRSKAECAVEHLPASAVQRILVHAGIQRRTGTVCSAS